MGGISLVVIALFFAFLTHNKLGKTFEKAAITENIVTEEVSSEQTIVESSEIESQTTKTEETSDEIVAISSEEVIEIPKSSVADYPTAEMKANFPSFRGPGSDR